MPASDEDGTRNRSTNSDPGPLLSGLGLWREAFLAWLGLLALLTGVHGLWWMLGESAPALVRYTAADLFRDGVLAFAGVYWLVTAAGSAAARLE